MTALVIQNAACAWRCWYCFVPEELLKADPDRSAWFTAAELVALYRQNSDPPRIIDLSGGSPDLVPEWTPWMRRALHNAGLKESTYLWTDDNLSTTYLFDALSPQDLALVRHYRNYGRVCCIKGLDARSFAFKTRAAPQDYDRQFEILKRVLALGIDVYGYVTLTSAHDDGVAAGVENPLGSTPIYRSEFPAPRRPAAHPGVHASRATARPRRGPRAEPRGPRGSNRRLEGWNRKPLLPRAPGTADL